MRIGMKGGEDDDELREPSNTVDLHEGLVVAGQGGADLFLDGRPTFPKWASVCSAAEPRT